MNQADKQRVEMLDEEGYGFQYAVIQRIRELFAARTSPWEFITDEFPVAAPDGRDSRIDILARHQEGSLYLVGECKRANPAYGEWLFARRPAITSGPLADSAIFEGAYVESGVKTVRGIDVGRPNYTYGIGVRRKLTNQKGDRGGGDGGRDIIEQTLRQTYRQVAGLVHHLFTTGAVKHQKYAIVIPVVFTTAELFTTSADLASSDLSTGLIGSATFEPTEWIGFQHLIDRSLRDRLGPVDIDFRRAMLRDLTRTIVITTPKGIERCLAEMGNWDPDYLKARLMSRS